MLTWDPPIVDPSGGAPCDADPALTPRPATLDGVRLGLLDNGKPNAAALLDALAERMGSRFRLAEVVRETKGYFGTPADEDQILRMLRSCDVAVTAIGD